MGHGEVRSDPIRRRRVSRRANNNTCINDDNENFTRILYRTHFGFAEDIQDSTGLTRIMDFGTFMEDLARYSATSTERENSE